MTTSSDRPHAIDGGLHVKSLTPDERGLPRCIHIRLMLVNLRLAVWNGECDHPFSTYGSYACYPARRTEDNPVPLADLLIKAMEWDGEWETLPDGWVKAYNAEEGEMRSNG